MRSEQRSIQMGQMGPMAGRERSRRYGDGDPASHRRHDRIGDRHERRLRERARLRRIGRRGRARRHLRDIAATRLAHRRRARFGRSLRARTAACRADGAIELTQVRDTRERRGWYQDHQHQQRERETPHGAITLRRVAMFRNRGSMPPGEARAHVPEAFHYGRGARSRSSCWSCSERHRILPVADLGSTSRNSKLEGTL